MSGLKFFALVVVCAVSSSQAFAHGLRLSVAPGANGLAGAAWYEDDEPAAGSTVTLTDAQGKEVARMDSDDEGRFAFGALAAGDYRVAVADDEGHRAETRAHMMPAPFASSPAVDDARLAAALRTELQPLREDVARFEQRIRLHDLIGGAGFIVGLFGLFVAWRARRR